MGRKNSKRNPLRRAGWDYRWPGSYFITICARDRVRYFGEVRDGRMHLSRAGSIANETWQQIIKHFSFVELGEHVIMPDHMHGIVHMKNYSEEELDDFVAEMNALGNFGVDTIRFQNPKSDSLFTIIGTYKAAVTRKIRSKGGEFNWQRRFSDVIIRSKSDLRRIENYIRNNPTKWREGE